MLAPIPLPLSVLIGGALGGASLGLALKDWRKVAILALLGALGLAVGVFATLTVAALFSYSPLLLGALVGVVVGASLGAAFLDWRTVLGLAVAGAVGFGVGLPAGSSYGLPFRLSEGWEVSPSQGSLAELSWEWLSGISKGAGWPKSKGQGSDKLPSGLRLYRYLQRFLEPVHEEGGPGFRFQDLRHTCATLLLRQGVHVKYVQELLGHASINITLDTYSHVIEGMDGGLADAMDDAL